MIDRSRWGRAAKIGGMAAGSEHSTEMGRLEAEWAKAA